MAILSKKLLASAFVAASLLSITGAAVAQNGKGMTWKAYPNVPGPAVRVGCANVCNAYTGDTASTTKLRVLCFVPGSDPMPAAYGTYAAAERPNDWQFYMGWSGGKVGLTDPIKGVDIADRAAADAYCQAQLSDLNAGIIEHHDNGSGGWSLGANVHANSKVKGQLQAGGNPKYWASINNQPANPWVD